VTEPLLTARQVGEWLGLSPATVLRRWRAGELPGYRLGPNVLRFNAAEIEAYLDAHRNGSDIQPLRVFGADNRRSHPYPRRTSVPLASHETTERD
jgi:excisionase family DNA binding protein